MAPAAVSVKFLRQLSAVVLAVTVIVGLGMLWGHASSGGSGLRQAPTREALLQLQQIKGGAIRIQSDNGFHLAATSNLIRTCVIEAVLAAVVITVSAIRRRRRRMRPTAGARS